MLSQICRTKEFDVACSHVGFCSDLRWATCNPDQYTLENRKLWILLNQIKGLLIQQKLPRTVQNTIPNSRLATYGNFQYDEDRERLYTEDSILPTSDECLESCSSTEPWELPEVEQYFRYFTALRAVEDFRWPFDIAPNRRYDLVELLRKLNSHTQVLELADEEWQIIHQFVVLQLGPRDKEHAFEPYQHYHLKNGEEQQLQIRVDSVKFLWDKCVPAGVQQHSFSLNSAVPEFHPRIFTRPLPYFPSSREKNYSDELFPYRCEETINPSQHVPTVYRTPKQQMASFLKSKDSHTRNIPVYQRPLEFYTQHQDGSNLTWGRRRQGVDYSNLIFLTHGGKGHHRHHGGRHHGKEWQQHPDLQFHPSPVQIHLHDWLQTDTSSPASLEKRYEELERIAIEEYRTPEDGQQEDSSSETFEDLERLAIEQYETPTGGAKSRQLTLFMAMTDVQESLPFLCKKHMMSGTARDQTEQSPRNKSKVNAGSTRKRRRRAKIRRMELEANHRPDDVKAQLETSCTGKLVPLHYLIKTPETWDHMYSLAEQTIYGAQSIDRVRMYMQDLFMVSLATGVPTFQAGCQEHCVAFMKQVLFQQHIPATARETSQLNTLQIIPTPEELEQNASGLGHVEGDQQNSLESDKPADHGCP